MSGRTRALFARALSKPVLARVFEHQTARGPRIRRDGGAPVGLMEAGRQRCALQELWNGFMKTHAIFVVLRLSASQLWLRRRRVLVSQSLRTAYSGPACVESYTALG